MRSLTIMLTRWCNLSCAHCGYASGPHLPRTTIDVALAQEAIEAAAARGATLVAFTGGEPFAFRQALQRLVAHGAACGLASEIATNASWAHTPAAARAALAPLVDAGLRQLLVSHDRYHAAFYRKPYARHAVHAALASGVRVQVRVAGPGDPETAAARTAQELGLPHELVDGPRARVRIVSRPLLAAGNARGLAASALVCGSSRPALAAGCADAIAHPAIAADGSLYPCCSFAAVESGDVLRTPLRAGEVGAALDRMRSRLLLRLISAIGPVRILALAGAPRPVEDGGSCAACLRLGTDVQAARAVAAWLHHVAAAAEATP